MQEASSSPQDVGGCQQLIEELSAQLQASHAHLQEQASQLQEQQARLHDRDTLVEEQAQTLDELQAARERLQRENETLELTIEKLLRQLYGNRRERVSEDPDQLHLVFDGDDPAARDALADAAAEAQRIIQEYTVRRQMSKPSPPRDERFPEHLPRVERIADVAETEKHCPQHGERTFIGYDETEKLMFEPPKLYVLLTKYPKYVCERQPACGVTQAERPTGLVAGDRYDAGVAAEIITAKYAYHLPFYRQQDWFAGSGWTPSRSTLLNILSAAEFVLQPLADHLRRLLLESGVLGCDETPVTLVVPPVLPQFAPSDPRAARIQEVLGAALEQGKPSVKARMWAYRAVDSPVNVFDFTVSRHRDGPDEILAGYTGKLMADCWSGFQQIELRSDARIQRGACWAHARRKVFEARASHPALASLLLALIRQLFDVEDRGKSLTAAERLELRQRESLPLLHRLRALIDGEAFRRVLPKSAFAEALGYLRTHWPALLLYTTDGAMPIDNNETEHLMKQIALGRKNWLMIGSVEAGNRAATLLTIVSSAVRNDLDVWAYLKDVLDQLLAGSTDYASLQADVWKQAHPEAVRSYRADERRDAADRRRLRRARRRLQRATQKPR